ncbi:hypothetical protein [Actinoplanes teichomyceticus]|uniref:hypothetical protein n=1 Tax=Actinoplanes teichomyceticus TaxID=1867 RepID=UPI000F09F315|nr:hypothetical protein [Actinoplanes teichomyceticus]GIF13770.1 hypothetical protein Ate01nite_38020 [Actinoplanes teichomyceticus]
MLTPEERALVAQAERQAVAGMSFDAAAGLADLRRRARQAPPARNGRSRTPVACRRPIPKPRGSQRAATGNRLRPVVIGFAGVVLAAMLAVAVVTGHSREHGYLDGSAAQPLGSGRPAAEPGGSVTGDGPAGATAGGATAGGGPAGGGPAGATNDGGPTGAAGFGGDRAGGSGTAGGPDVSRTRAPGTHSGGAATGRPGNSGVTTGGRGVGGGTTGGAGNGEGTPGGPVGGDSAGGDRRAGPAAGEPGSGGGPGAGKPGSGGGSAPGGSGSGGATTGGSADPGSTTGGPGAAGATTGGPGAPGATTDKAGDRDATTRVAGDPRPATDGPGAAGPGIGGPVSGDGTTGGAIRRGPGGGAGAVRGPVAGGTSSGRPRPGDGQRTRASANAALTMSGVPGPAPTAAGPGAADSSRTRAPQAGASRPVAAPTGPFRPLYRATEVTVVVDGAKKRAISLTQPHRKVAEGGGDVVVSRQTGVLHLDALPGVRTATVAGSEATPAQCQRAIRDRPTGSSIELREGETYCLMTSGAGLPGAALVRLNVATAGDGREVTLKMAAWDTPG